MRSGWVWWMLVAGLAGCLAVCPLVCATAQDARSVTEPKYPAICKILYAELAPVNGTLPEEPVERHYRDNGRIEKAMAACPAGQSVVLHGSKTGRTIFLIGPLKLRAGVTLVVDGSAAVWASRDPRNYDVQPGSCGIVGARGAGCLPLILAEDAPHSGLMGEGMIDGRGGAKLLGQNETWWELAHRAKVEDQNQAVSRLLVVRRSNDFTLYHVTLKNSPNCHVTTESTDGFTAWGVRIDTPKWARNTDGIDPQAGSRNVSIVSSWIRSGDDNISPKSTAQGGAVTQMTVRDVHFYNGHGFGIGSQTSGGISHIRVIRLTIDGADNGLRIKSDKSRGGVVEDVQFKDVCIRNSPNPIVLNPFYTTFDGDRIPLYRGIVLDAVHALTPGLVTMRGLDAAHALEATLRDVTIDNQKAEDVVASFARFRVHGGNLQPKGEDVSVTSVSASAGTAAGFSCTNAFPAYTDNPMATAPGSAELIPPADETFYVAADGTGDYYSVQAAVNKVPASGGLVLVAPGIYRERVTVRQRHVTLKSANADAAKTVIVSDTTRGSGQGFATVTVRGDDFRAENITFQNDFRAGAASAAGAGEVRGASDTRNPLGAEAQALHLTGDRNVLRNVRLLGGQHTAYFGAKMCQQSSGNPCEPGRSLVMRSYIAGNTDFIYGDGAVFFDDCNLYSTEHPLDHGAMGFVTAQGKHYAGQQSLFVFRNARLTAAPGVSHVFLGQPWRDLSTVVYLSPTLGSHIDPVGFRERLPGGAARQDTAFLRVYQPLGTATQAKQLSADEAKRFGPGDVLGGKDGWLPEDLRGVGKR